MSKRLVMCCDGTWNTPDQSSDGRPSPTNVTKLALAVSPRDAGGREQRVFYHRGVGTNRRERIWGGAFGLGLSRNVRDTYRFVVANYEPGDELFLVGFSRGAYTARSTAGLIRNCGVLRRENADRVPEAYALYRDRGSRSHPRGTEARLFRRTYSHEPRIRFIGVWDTVGALGIPLSGLRLVNLLNRRWQFHDTDLSTSVDAAFQALAVDERRGPFRPAVWRRQPDAGDQRLEQVWFAGVHCDVGGGYRDPGLSEIALLWMVQRARECGLAFEPGWFSPVAAGAEPEAGQRAQGALVAPDALGQVHESRKGFYVLLPAFARPLGEADAAHEYASSSAVQRLRRREDYRPANLEAYLAGGHQVMEV